MISEKDKEIIISYAKKFASSKESVGEFWFGQFPKCMI